MTKFPPTHFPPPNVRYVQERFLSVLERRKNENEKKKKEEKWFVL